MRGLWRRIDLQIITTFGSAPRIHILHVAFTYFTIWWRHLYCTHVVLTKNLVEMLKPSLIITCWKLFHPTTLRLVNIEFNLETNHLQAYN